MMIKATYIGKTDLIYKNGERYLLKASDMAGVHITKLDDYKNYNGGKRIYHSLAAFFKEWDDVGNHL